MTRTAHADRLWAVGGALAAAVLLAISWFFLVSPQNAETAKLDDQAAVAQDRIGPLQRRLTELRKQQSELPRYKAELERNRQALPTNSGLTDFLRYMQTSGDAAGVQVSGVSVGAPTQVTAAGTKLHAITITVTAVGKVPQVQQFLHQLQQVQPRAVLVGNLNTTNATTTAAAGDALTLTVGLQVFVAPPAPAAPAGK